MEDKTTKIRPGGKVAGKIGNSAPRVNLGCLPVGQQPNKQGYAPPRDTGESRLAAMMREYARARWTDKANYARLYGKD